MDEAAIELRDTGSSFLSLSASDDVRRETVGPRRVGLAFLMNREAFRKPARHAVMGGGEHEDVVHLVPQRVGPVERAGLASRRAVHGDDGSERHTERAETGHALGADGEVVVVRVHLDLHRTRQRHLVLLRVGGRWRASAHRRSTAGEIAASFVSSFRIVCGVLEINGEVLVAVEQAQAVDRRRVAVAVVVAHLELLPRFVLLAEAHQVDARAATGPTTDADRDRWPCDSRRRLRRSGG